MSDVQLIRARIAALKHKTRQHKARQQVADAKRATLLTRAAALEAN